MEGKRIKLGQRVRDKITGFTGVAVSRCEYLNGCIQYSVQPPVDEKNLIPKDQWIDEQQLIKTEMNHEKTTDLF